MSAAATAKAKHTDLWMILSESGRYHTVHGWSSRPDFALLFTRDEVDRFVEANSESVFAVHYDRTAHDEVRVIGQKTDSAEIHHDLDKVALAAVNELESRHGTSDLRVEVVSGRGHDSAPDPEHLDALAKRTLHHAATTVINEPAEYTRRFDAALARYDAAFEAYRERVQAARGR